MAEPVELTKEERKAIEALADAGEVTRGTLLTGAQAAAVRAIARAEIASLAGLVLRRTSEEHLSRSPDRNITDTQIRGMLAEIFGEVLADFSGHTGGDEPGEEASPK